MNWTRFALTVLAAGIATSITDWFFMGILFHDKYNEHPEVWRHPKGEDKRAIGVGVLMGFFACAVFAFVCYRLNLQIYSVTVTLKLALAVWAMAPLPLVISNSLWMKLHPLIAVAHAAGWLARFAVTAVAVTIFWK